MAGVELSLLVAVVAFGLVARNLTRLTPREVVHPPEGVERQEEREDRNGEDVEDHPANHIPLAAENEHERLKTVDSRDEDDRQNGDRCMYACSEVDEVDDLRKAHVSVSKHEESRVTYVCHGDRLNNGRKKVDHNDEAHGADAHEGTVPPPNTPVSVLFGSVAAVLSHPACSHHPLARSCRAMALTAEAKLSLHLMYT